MIEKEEKKTTFLINKKIKDIIIILQKDKTEINKGFNNFNPLTSHLYYKISFYYMILILSKNLKYLENYKFILTNSAFEKGKENKLKEKEKKLK